MSQLRERSPRLLALDGETVSVRVRESRRARSLRVRLGPSLPLEAIVPSRVSDVELDRFLAGRRGWIARKLAEMRSLAARPRLGLHEPDVVWLGLRPIPVTVDPASGAVARLRAGRLAVGPDAAQAAIERWYRRQARQRIAAAVERESERVGVRPGVLAIRDPKTRWGSCSSRGTLGFSWRLVIAPPEILDYVVVHELCHLRELNHGKAFWRLLGTARPGWREEAGWLRQHGWELHDYRVVLTAAPSR